jgi:hypothetical protein
MASFFQTVTAAINDILEYGYESEDRLEYWMEALREAAKADMVSEDELTLQLQRVLGKSYDRLIHNATILKHHPDVPRFTIDKLKPELHAELDRRLLAARSLIRLNRAQMMAEMEQRFAGWASSVPAGGTDNANRKETKGNIRESLASLSFRERRVMIDQAHKLNAALSDIIATDQDAIAAEWHSHWREAGYNYRQDHKERDRVIYAMRDSWAVRDGFIAAGSHGYYEDHERPGEFVYCRCYVSFKYNLRDMPKAMLTEKGKAALAEARVKAMAL